MKRLVLSIACLVALTSSAIAQRRGPVISPEVLEDGQVTFRTAAPGAKQVSVMGQWPDGRFELEKNSEGVWEATREIPTGIWEYSFSVDGVAMLDPNNSAIKPMRSPRTSILHIPSNPPSNLDFQPVPHGTVHQHEYDSTAGQRRRRIHVYTPPGYESNTDAKYPVLYLQHGSGDNDATWIDHGKAHWIADNLIAAGKAKPMIIVMLDGHIAPPNDRGSNTELFGKDLIEQVGPMVETLYRIDFNRESRGIVGLSMGGGQSLTVGLNNLDYFAYVGGFSSSVPTMDAVSQAVDHAEESNKRLKLLWIACGKDDFLLERNETFIAQLKEKDIHHEWFKTDGDHSWPIWRTYLIDFLPRLFQ